MNPRYKNYFIVKNYQLEGMGKRGKGQKRRNYDLEEIPLIQARNNFINLLYKQKGVNNHELI